MSKVVVATHDPVGRAMAGPAIRSLELARQLHHAGNDVTIAVPDRTDLDEEPFEVATYDLRSFNGLRRVAEDAEVVVLQAPVLGANPYLSASGACLVIDLYDPFPLAHLAMTAVENAPGKYPAWLDVLAMFDELIRQGDFFMCASERQRDLWIGAMLALNRVNEATYRRDPSLHSLIDIVPFGLPDGPPERTEPAMRGMIPGIGADDFILLWGGGVYNWFDPLTLIQAVGRVAPLYPNVRLCFLSTTHPNPDVPEMAVMGRARRLAAQLNLLNRHVFFNETWVAYGKRSNWLLDADVGVSTHFDHVETRFSFRTRLLDYFWAGLPMICTAGDSFSELIATESLGFVVPAEDVAALACAIQDLAKDHNGTIQRSARVRELARQMTWGRAAEPLVRFCSRPRKAADLAQAEPFHSPPVPLRTDAERKYRGTTMTTHPNTAWDARYTYMRSREILAERGVNGLATAVARRLRPKR